MLGTVNWLARSVGLAWLGIVAFVLAPPSAPHALPVQVAGYSLLAIAYLALVLIELHPAARRHRSRGLPLILGVMAVSSGFASAAGGGGALLVIFTVVTAIIAGADISLLAAAAVTAAGIVAIEVSGLALGASGGLLVGFPPFVIAGLLIGRNRGAYRIQAEQSARLLAQRDQLEAEQRRADLLDERARIAREIHDVLAHSLGALGIQIQAARAVLTDNRDLTKADEMLATAQRMAADGLVETRRAVQALRADTLALTEELARVSDTHARRYDVAASFSTGGVPVPLPPDATVALLRVAQESLVNAAKHAAGQSIAVQLDYGDKDVRLTVTNELDPAVLDDVTAASQAERTSAAMATIDGGYGLTGMRERLLLQGGSLDARRLDNHWIVTAELPRSRQEKVSP